MVTKAARGRKPKPESRTDTLLKALRFVALAQSDIGTVSQRHCVIHSGWVCATNNVMTLGVKVVDDLTACPQTKRLIAALERCGDGVTITQQDADRLRVVSGGLRVSVPCAELSQIGMVWADPIGGPVDARFTDALRAIAHIASETATKVHMASILCEGPVIKATTGEVIAEYWHGCDLPPYFVLPSATVNSLLKIDKPLVGLGYGGNRVTFHFDDESWLRSQLYEDKWPNTDEIWSNSNNEVEPVEIPPTLFDAANVLTAFSETGFVDLQDGLLATVGKLTDVSEQEVAGLKKGPRLKLKNLLLLKDIAKTMKPFTNNMSVLFMFGDKLRMAIATARNNATTDDDIPPF